VRKAVRSDRGGHDRWLVSYADLVTLLLAFFTTLYAASKVDATKMAPLSASLQQAFKVDPGAPVVAASAPESRPTIVPPVEVVPRRPGLNDIRIALDAGLADDIRNHRAEITMDPRGLVVTMPEDAVFEVASTDPSPTALALVSRMASAVRGLPNDVRIEGHTDNVPIRTPKYRSNWELSTARASAVVAYLIESEGIDPARLSAAGYGEFHPRAANDTPANRARNRRIDIIVLEDHARLIP
jgi:chemotaxis protein MotB